MMKITQNNSLRLIKQLLFIVAMLACLNGCNKTADNEAQMDAQTATTMQKYGIMSQTEYFHLAKLRVNMENQTPLSVSDVNWLLAMAQRGTGQKRYDRMYQAVMVFSDGPRSCLPPNRINQIFNLAIQAVQYTGHPTGLPLFGCFLLGHLNDKRAIPYLTPLLSSNDLDIRVQARKTIYKLSR